MAEGLLKSMMPEHMKTDIAVSSAGTNALDGNPAESNAIRAMKEFGIDITAHIARSITKRMIAEAAYIFVMEPRHKTIIDSGYGGKGSKIHLLAEFSPTKNLGNIFDPYGESIEVYRNCASIIRGCIGNAVNYLGEKLHPDTGLRHNEKR